MIYLVLIAHGTLQFLIPMPNMESCMNNHMVMAEMITKDADVGAKIGCFDVRYQAFYTPREPLPMPGEKVD